MISIAEVHMEALGFPVIQLGNFTYFARYFGDKTFPQKH